MESPSLAAVESYRGDSSILYVRCAADDAAGVRRRRPACRHLVAWWCEAVHWLEDFSTTGHAKGFDVVQIVAGL